MSITDTELDLLFPETNVVIAGHEFEIRPFSFAETRTVVKKLKGVLHIFTSDEITVDLIAQVFDEAFDGVCDVIAMAYGLDRKSVEKLDNNAAIQAIAGIIEVNKDFFAQTITPTIEDLVEKVGLTETPKIQPKVIRSRNKS